MTPPPFVPLGRVVKAHGLKGEVSVAPAADLPFAFGDDLEVWLVPPPVGTRSGRLESIRPGPKGPLVKITGIDDIDAAQRLIGSELLAKASDLPAAWLEPTEDEAGVLGYRVSDEEHGSIGEVIDIIVTGANDVWVVHGALGEVLLPVIDDVVLRVDDEDRSAFVRLLPGLLPERHEAR